MDKGTSPIRRAPFYFIRHGETDWNRENRAMGQADIPLNANGILQAMTARERFRDAKITTICHSPLSRAKQTAEIINQVVQVSMVEIENLKEFHLGSYQGTIKEAWFKEWRSNAFLPGTERYEEFLARATQGIKEALALGGRVLIVAHGGVYWALEAHVQSGVKEIPNCAPSFYEPLPDETWKCIPVS